MYRRKAILTQSPKELKIAVFDHIATLRHPRQGTPCEYPQKLYNSRH